jgi:23S rRNA (cytosine1962-C5)-methyltransferase
MKHQPFEIASIDCPSFFDKQSVILKPGKEKAIQNRHHWIFSGAVQSLPSFKDGDLLPVRTSGGQLLGTGYFNRKSGIIGRMIAFDDTPPLQAISDRLDKAIALRNTLFDKTSTNAFRLINGEGDGLPGLTVDVYDTVLVIQIGTKGMDVLRPLLVDYLDLKLKPLAIYEKSLTPSRKEEGLPQFQGVLKGAVPESMTVKENGLLFTINFEKSQKTGFFLDHREMREWVRGLASGKRVLNAFSYTGGFSVYALAGGAVSVDSVDISEDACELSKKHVKLNGFEVDSQGFFCKDVFQFLREEDFNYDLVILDPPAFAKRQKDVIQACRGYKDINRLAMEKMPPGSLLLTCSCSHHVDETLFQKVMFQAAHEAKRQVRIIGRHRLASDHPINLYHPESDYLKSLLLYIE